MKKVAVITDEYAQELNGVMYAPSSYCNPVQDGMGRWVISLEEMTALGLECEVVEWVAPVDLSNMFGGYYRRSETVNENGLYTIESSESPTLSDGTILTESNKDTYDGAEGWHWYDSGQVVDIKVTPARWESIKNWFTGLF